MSESFEPAPRKVRPRTRTYKHLPVIAIAGQEMLTEQGLLSDPQDLLLDLPNGWPPTLFARQAAADFIAELDKTFSSRYPTTWQWRASVNERDIIRPDGFRVASRISTVIYHFGFKGGNYHKIIDPVTMYGHRLNSIWPGEEPSIVKLLQWAVTLRDFCHENGMDIRPTIGGISSQFLTDRRFYDEPRRKVPRAINERGREALPGNHYHLVVHPSPHREFTALYLDQHRAHHYHARTTPLPDSDQLYAHGRFTDLAEIVFKSTWEGFHGLYCLDLEPPSKSRRSHWIRNLHSTFVFSNEISHLQDMGYKILGVRAAWGSFKRDWGIPRYATWASEQLDLHGDKPWLKPLLLATYGTLATRAKYAESVFRLAKSGEGVTLLTGHHQMNGNLVRATKKLEPNIASVLQRGMIEAATRSESVGYGQYLADHGWRVLSVYADAVIIKDDPEQGYPPTFEPWRCKTKLNHLQFINQQAFISGEMTKLPGVSQELAKYRMPLAR